MYVWDLALITFCMHLQDKITKEANFILSNQELIESQITQLEAAIKQMEVHKLLVLVLHHTPYLKRIY